MLGLRVRRRVLDLHARPITWVDRQRVAEGICAASLKWTIVVLRDGRRSRPWHADVAQLVAHHLAKVRVAGSNPVIRSRVQSASTPAVEWPSGEATACKAVHTGSIPVSTSEIVPGAISSAGERFPDTEEVTGSIPVSRTSITAGQTRFFGAFAVSAQQTRNKARWDAGPLRGTEMTQTIRQLPPISSAPWCEDGGRGDRGCRNPRRKPNGQPQRLTYCSP